MATTKVNGTKSISNLNINYVKQKKIADFLMADSTMESDIADRQQATAFE